MESDPNTSPNTANTIPIKESQDPKLLQNYVNSPNNMEKKIPI